MGRFHHLGIVPAADGRLASARAGNGRQRLANGSAGHVRRSVQRPSGQHLLGPVRRSEADRRSIETNDPGGHPAALRRRVLFEQRVAGAQYDDLIDHEFTDIDDDSAEPFGVDDAIAAEFVRHFAAQSQADERNVGIEEPQRIQRRPDVIDTFRVIYRLPCIAHYLYRPMNKKMENKKY